MKVVGSILGEFEDHETTTPTVFLRAVNGTGIELLSHSRAEALFEQVTAIPMTHVTGDMSSGYAWPVFGARPRHSQAVIPLAAPAWPDTQRAAMVCVELWWPPDEAGYRRIRSFLGLAPDPFDAYLIACCLWSSRSTGSGAEAAFLYGPDRATVYRINEMAKTCALVPADAIARFAATVADRDTTDPLPDQPRGDARP